LRIAIACSGLGHVQRGVEAWAADVFGALRQMNADVTLFAGRPAEDAVALPCLRRNSSGAIRISRVLRHLGGWRYGMGSAYAVEQNSFALALWPHIWKDYDILHVQDPLLALWLERAHRCGLSRPIVIYANGTGERLAIMRRFSTLQLLTPTMFDCWQRNRAGTQTGFLIPNCVDTDRFCPGDQIKARALFSLPQEALIVLCCAAIRRFHKRIDYLLEEFAAAEGKAMLVVAGAREEDTEELIALGTRLLGPRVRFLPDLPRDAMPVLYQAADVFVLPSLSEMFGTVLIEAAATGLPVICNDTLDFRYVAGPAGFYRDLSRPGGLAAVLSALQRSDQPAWPQGGRAHIISRFDTKIIARQVLEMYRAATAAPRMLDK
jgi:glycosyltransferase involved in cell wall biosynthesis